MFNIYIQDLKLDRRGAKSRKTSRCWLVLAVTCRRLRLKVERSGFEKGDRRMGSSWKKEKLRLLERPPSD